MFCMLLVQIYDIKFVGLNPENGRKLLLSIALIVVVVLARWSLRAIGRVLIRGNTKLWRGRFWTHQAISLVCAAFLVIGLLSIWFDNPGAPRHLRRFDHGGSRDRTAEGDHVAGGLLRYPARQNVFRRRPNRDGECAWRRRSAWIYANYDYGNGTTPAGAERKSSDVGAQPTVYRPDCDD
jgi:hypothetical protein